MYKVGKYNYKSIESYQKLLLLAILVFVICIIDLVALRDQINPLLYTSTVMISILMIVHLFFRYAKSKNWVKEYIFNEY